MKNPFKLSLLTVFIALSAVACKGHSSGGSPDSAKVDSSSSMKSTTDTTVKVDSSRVTDTSKMKTDTVGKTVTKSTEVKKTAVKKN
jgi:hypothetical protein